MRKKLKNLLSRILTLLTLLMRMMVILSLTLTWILLPMNDPGSENDLLMNDPGSENDLRLENFSYYLLL